MAVVTDRETGRRVEDSAEIAAFLAKNQMIYEKWDISRLASTPKRDGESDQDHVLRVFADEVSSISARRGYQAADVISLWPTTPDLDVLLAKFNREHIHSEDEVRFVVSGRGVFTVRDVDGDLWDFEVHPGDLLAVPESKQHWFELCDDRHIQCIRLFTDKAGWVAQYV